MTHSEIMKRIRSRGNKSTELAVAYYFRKAGVKGWRRHQKVLGISIDFIFPKTKLAVFVDGCFWHACQQHAHLDRLKEFWFMKVIGNRVRDLRQTKLLTENGWHVHRIWEHDLKGIKPCK